jgi:hypothetical protein
LVKGIAFRLHPPIVSLQINKSNKDASNKAVDIGVIASDGIFDVFSYLPTLPIKFKGSTILPAAMTHMILTTISRSNTVLPNLAGIQMTDSSRLFMNLSLSPFRDNYG